MDDKAGYTGVKLREIGARPSGGASRKTTAGKPFDPDLVWTQDRPAG